MGRPLRPDRRRRHPPASLRRPHVQAALPRGRPHRARDDPHAAGPRSPDGLSRLHGMRGDEAAHRRRPGLRRRRLLARTGTLRRVPGEVGRSRDRGDREGLEDHLQLLGVHRRRDGARVRRGSGARRHGVRAVPPHGNGLAARGAGPARHRSGPGRGRRTAQPSRRAIHGTLRSGETGPLDPRRRGAGDLHGGSRGPRNRARRSVPGHLAEAGRVREAQAPEHVPPVPGARRRRHHEGTDGGRTHLPLHDGGRAGRRGNRGDECARSVRGGGGRGGTPRGEPRGGRTGGPDRAGRVRRATDRRSDRGDARVLRTARRGKPVRGASGSDRDDAEPGRDLPQPG